MATGAEVINIIEEILGDATAVAEIVKGVDPALALPISVAEELAALAAKALSAANLAASTPITTETVTALEPDPTPLTPTTE